MKRQGIITELRFMSEVSLREIAVSLPYGDNEKYDCITDGSELKRVQIKSTSRHETSSRLDAYNALVCHGASNKEKYTSEDCDIIAIYVIPYDAWYLIPVDEINGKTVKLYPHREGSTNKYEKWREAWSLL